MAAGKLDDIASALKAAYGGSGGGIMADVFTDRRPFWEALEDEPTPMKVAQDITSLMLFSIPDPAEREKAATAMIPLLLRLVRMAEVVQDEEEEESRPTSLSSGRSLTEKDLLAATNRMAQGYRKPDKLIMGPGQLAAYQKYLSHVYVPPDGQQPVKAVVGGVPVVLDSQVPPGEVYVIREDEMRERVMRVRAEELAGEGDGGE